MRMFFNDVILIPAPYYLLSRDNVFLESHVLLVKSPVILRVSGEFRHCSFFTSPEFFQLLQFNKLLEDILIQQIVGEDFKHCYPEKKKKKKPVIV